MLPDDVYADFKKSGAIPPRGSSAEPKAAPPATETPEEKLPGEELIKALPFGQLAVPAAKFAKNVLTSTKDIGNTKKDPTTLSIGDSIAKGFLQTNDQNLDLGGTWLEPMPIGAVRMFAGDAVANTISPYFWLTGKTPPKSNLDKTLRRQDLNNPNDFAKVMDPSMKGVGSMAAFPMGGGSNVIRKAVTGMGMGEGSDLLGRAGKAVGGALGGETGGAVGEGVGSFVGGALGAPLNVMRANALGKLVSTPVNIASSATRAAMEAFKQRSTRAMWDTFTDEFSSLRSQAKSELQNYVNKRLAGDLKIDPETQRNVARFEESTKVTGAKADEFSLAQKTATPALVATVAERKPSSLKEANVVAADQGKAKNEIVRIYNTGKDALPPSAQSHQFTWNQFRNTVLMRNKAYDLEADKIKKTLTNHGAESVGKAGEDVKAAYDKEHEQGRVKTKEDYTRAADISAQREPQGFDVSPVGKTAKTLLDQFPTQVEGAPKSIVNLKKILGMSEEEPKHLLGSDGKPIGNPLNDPESAKHVSLKDINQAMIDLNDDISGYLAQGGPTAANNAKQLGAVRDELRQIVREKGSPETNQAFDLAQKNYKDNMVPRFKTGINYNLDREGAKSNKNLDLVRDADVIDRYLDASGGGKDTRETIKQFRDLANSPYTGEKNPVLYAELGKGIESRYSKTVLQTAGKARDLDMKEHDVFMDRYKVAIDEVPGLEAKLNKTANDLVTTQERKKWESDRYKIIMDSPVSSKLDPTRAKQLYSDVFANERKAAELTRALGPEATKAAIKEAMLLADPLKNGEYDSKALRLFADQPGLSAMYKGAFGEVEGAAQVKRLKAIADLAERQAITDPKNLRPQDALNLTTVKSVTGSSSGSIYSDIKALNQGRTGLGYTVLTAGGRFWTAKATAALERAQNAALYDPVQAKAILELMSTPGEEAISKGAANAVWGKVSGLVDYMTGKGYIRTTVARGAGYGASQAQTPEERAEARKRRVMEMQE